MLAELWERVRRVADFFPIAMDCHLLNNRGFGQVVDAPIGPDRQSRGSPAFTCVYSALSPCQLHVVAQMRSPFTMFSVNSHALWLIAVAVHDVVYGVSP